MKVYVVGDSVGYMRFIEGAELTDKLADADIVLFTGGEDVTPKLYGCRKDPSTYCNPSRDAEEAKVFSKIKPEQLAIGICRGSQFLCAMNKGLLVQDCSNHAIGRTHEITNGNVVYEITSTHHQMQYPYNLPTKDYDLLFWANLSSYYNGDKIEISKIRNNGEPEIVLYHKENLPKCLAIQGHPEMMPVDSATVKMINVLIKKYSK